MLASNCSIEQPSMQNPYNYFSYHMLIQPSPNISQTQPSFHMQPNLNIDTNEQITQYTITIQIPIPKSTNNSKSQTSRKYHQQKQYLINQQNQYSSQNIHSIRASIHTTYQKCQYQDSQIDKWSQKLWDINVIFYLLFAKFIIIPKNKTLKNTLRTILEELGLDQLAIWQKDKNSYKVIFEESAYICMQDIKDVSILTPLNKPQTLQHITSIKQKNAYIYCLNHFHKNIKPQLLQCHQSQSVQMYEKCLKNLQILYNQVCCRNRMKKLRNFNGCDPNDNHYSFRKLKEKVRQALICSQQESRVKNKQNQNQLDYLDQQCKQFLTETLTQLFHTEFQHLPTSPNTPIESTLHKYRTVVRQIAKHINLQAKSVCLIEVMLTHMSTSMGQNCERKGERQGQGDSQLVSFRMEGEGEGDQLLISESSVEIGVQKNSEPPIPNTNTNTKSIIIAQPKAQLPKIQRSKKQAQTQKQKQNDCPSTKQPQKTPKIPPKLPRKSLTTSSSHKQLKWRI